MAMFDTLRAFHRLREAGFEEAQAEAIARFAADRSAARNRAEGVASSRVDERESRWDPTPWFAVFMAAWASIIIAAIAIAD